jgi:glycosyltransferase involved in cell wall biosynthesis
VVHVFPAFATGGPEVRTAVLINTMTEFAHTIVSLNGDVSGRSRLDRPDSVVFTPAVFHRGMTTLRTLGQALRAQRPDLLVTYGWGGTDAILGARLAGLPTPLHVEDGFLPDEALGQKLTRLQVRRLAFRLAAALVVPSKTLERIATDTWWLPTRRVRYFPNGVDTDRFAPASVTDAQSARQSLGVAPGEIVVGTVGMLRPDKNHARLIRVFDAATRERAARLVIVGEGPCRAELDQLTRALGIGDRVIFTGAVVDPASCYRAFDVFALSSDTEQMPLSVLEAMASGLPVVSTDVGDVADMIVPPAGGLVSPRGDDTKLQEHLAFLCHDQTQRRQVGAENRARALAQFSLGRMIESYRRLFHQHLTLSGAEA